MATASPAVAPTSGARDTCVRCGQTFASFDDRRAQPTGGDLCRACHLDPRARSLALDGDGGWLRRCARTMAQLLIRPGASFREVEEPVAHDRVLGFLATLRLTTWAVAVVWAGVVWFFDLGPRELTRPSVLGLMLGPQFADVLRLWLLLLVPIGLPMLYFFGGILAHSGMALTGGARRSIGASMRAFGLALAPSLVLIGVLDILVIGVGIQPELWGALVLAAAGVGLILLGIALARTHVTSVVRGLVVALVPIVLFTAVTVGRGLLEYYRLPYQPAPEIENYAPYPIK